MIFALRWIQLTVMIMLFIMLSRYSLSEVFKHKKRRGLSRMKSNLMKTMYDDHPIPTRNICYQWMNDTGLFTPRKINANLTEDPPFNRKRGILPGEDGGRHVLKNITIPPPVLSAAQKACQEFLNENWTYTSTEGQDKLVIQLLQGKRNGFFIDVGARYWNKGSNSFSLEYYYDWKGICVEPDERMYTGLVVNRTCTVICENPIDEKENKSVYFNYHIGGSATRSDGVGSNKVTTTLKEIFTKFHIPTKVDYLSLDIEGFETAAMKTVDLKAYTFSIISVERPPELFHKKLTEHGYSWLTQLRGKFGEMIYIHRSIDNYTNIMNAYRPYASSHFLQSNHIYFHEPPWPELPKSNITHDARTALMFPTSHYAAVD